MNFSLETSGMTSSLSLAQRLRSSGAAALIFRTMFTGLRARTRARALTHAARHEAPDQDLAVKPQRPNHRASHPVRLGDQGLVGNIDPDILKADSIVAVL